MVADHRFGRAIASALTLRSSNTASIDQVATLERAVVGGRGDARQQRVALRRGGAAALDLLAHELLRMLLAAVGGRLVAIDQHHLDAGERRHIGDAGAHEAGAETPMVLNRVGGTCAGRRAPLLSSCSETNSERIMAAACGERRTFANQRDSTRSAEIHRQLQALIDHLQDGARGRVIVVGLAPVDRVGGRERHHAGLGIDRAAGQPETLLVPGPPWRTARLDPVLGALDQLGRGRDGIDELHALGLLQAKLVALEQELQRVCRLQHACHPLGAAGAGKQPDLDLGQAHARLLASAAMR